MKRLLVLLIVIGIIVFIFRITKEKVRQDFANPLPYPTVSISPSVSEKAGPEKNSLFVPYWTIKSEMIPDTSYQSFLYFGVKPTTEGLDKKEPGFSRIDSFFAIIPEEAEKLLVVRMIDSSTNFAILKEKAAQKKIISQTSSVAKEKGFDGIVLDLEVSAIPFDSVVQQITSFTSLFYQETKKSNLTFAITIYGDVFYRLRPYDMKEIAKNTDEILIMAYDFSKARSDPGPNFPLWGKEEFGYDYEKMVADFSSVVPREKLVVIFGLFGYDWMVDDNGKALEQGKALTTNQIEEKFINNCSQQRCSFERDSKAFETKVTYVDREGQSHIIWFEDVKSIEAKKAFLKKQGINSFSYWAHSYF